MWNVRWRAVINNRDAMIAATVVQWLGTNCGRAFLDQALRQVGMRIEYDREWTKRTEVCERCRGVGGLRKGEGEARCGWCGNPWRSDKIAA